jgi:hypothetical protein
MNWTFEASKMDDLSIEGDELFRDSAETGIGNGSSIFGFSELTEVSNCTGCLNELCIAEADYEVYR